MNNLLRALIREEVKKTLDEGLPNMDDVPEIDLDDLDDEENQVMAYLPDENPFDGHLRPEVDPRYEDLGIDSRFKRAR